MYSYQTATLMSIIDNNKKFCFNNYNHQKLKTGTILVKSKNYPLKNEFASNDFTFSITYSKHILYVSKSYLDY